MAKGSLFVGSGSGKVGNLVLANTKSGQVTRVYQPNVKNPKTRAQMLQRAKFACAVKFFKQATNGLFKFAFEDKTSKESDYNAYMRHNIQYALPLSRELYENPSVPALGNQFMMSQGRLTSPATLSFVAKSGETTTGPKEDLTVTLPAAAADATIGAVSKVLIDAGLVTGDIITIVRVSSEVDADGLQDLSNYTDNPEAPHWTIYQFILDSADTTALTAVPARGYDTNDAARALTISEDKKSLAAVFTDGKAQWGALIVTRKVDSGLYASNSYLIGDTEGKAMATYVASDAAVETALNSWKSSETAILKGAIANG